MKVFCGFVLLFNDSGTWKQWAGYGCSEEPGVTCCVYCGLTVQKETEDTWGWRDYSFTGIKAYFLGILMYVEDQLTSSPMD